MPDFTDRYPKRGQPAYAPWRLALVTLLQFREGLSDRQAADAVHARIDWKYLLALDLADPGFDRSVLCAQSVWKYRCTTSRRTK
jgi:transposase